VAFPQGRVALLQFVPITLKCLKPNKTDFEPHTLGEHVKKKRLELGLTQKEAGQRLGVTQFTVINWECGFRKPRIQNMPAVQDFLGYVPNPPMPITLPERLAAGRRDLGWTQKTAARKLGVDPCTWSDWERGGTIMAKAHRRMVAKFLGLREIELYSTMRKRWNDSHGRPTPEQAASDGIGRPSKKNKNSY
jgi:transcriptional regulator with XRE-family HTH domain